MLHRIHALLTAMLLSFSAQASVAIEIPRTLDGTLGQAATPATVTAMLTGAAWRYSNPAKETSTWESKTLAFDATKQSVDVTTLYAYGPRTDTLPWQVVSAGTTPAVEIGGVRYAVSPCKLAPRTTCLGGLRLP